ncbi:hypothetical protein AMTRI_Chr13g122230 [Amborella trichopoda]
MGPHMANPTRTIFHYHTRSMPRNIFHELYLFGLCSDPPSAKAYQPDIRLILISRVISSSLFAYFLKCIWSCIMTKIHPISIASHVMNDWIKINLIEKITSVYGYVKHSLCDSFCFFHYNSLSDHHRVR